MARFETNAQFTDLTGKLSKDSDIIMRQKTWRHPITGEIMKVGPKEMFVQQKRDFKRNPRRGAEAEQHDRWKAACREAQEICSHPLHPRYKELHDRWLAQLDGTPDPALNGKQVLHFANFVRALLARDP